LSIFETVVAETLHSCAISFNVTITLHVPSLSLN
jgi:hypothetical protein